MKTKIPQFQKDWVELSTMCSVAHFFMNHIFGLISVPFETTMHYGFTNNYFLKLRPEKHYK